MRIALASENGVGLAAHPGRVPGFVILEHRQGAWRPVEFRSNPMAHHHAAKIAGETHEHQHEQEHHHHDHGTLVEALADCDALIAGGIGPRLVTDLTARGIRVFVSGASTVEEAAADYTAGRLAPMVAGGACPQP